jgi:hypothetical protein
LALYVARLKAAPVLTRRRRLRKYLACFTDTKGASMPKTTLVFAALLIALGLGAFGMSSSRTALLPAYVGIALGLIAGLALVFDSARKHLMHVAAVVALLGALAPAAALAIRAAKMSPLALSVNLGMLALSATLLALMVRSFILARRARAA